MSKTTKAKKADILESIGHCKALIRYYNEMLDGGFEQKEQQIQNQISTLQKELDALREKRAKAPESIKMYRARIIEFEKQIDIEQVQPLIRKAEKTFAKLLELKEQLKDVNISSDDLNLLRDLLGE